MHPVSWSKEYETFTVPYQLVTNWVLKNRCLFKHLSNPFCISKANLTIIEFSYWESLMYKYSTSLQIGNIFSYDRLVGKWLWDRSFLRPPYCGLPHFLDMKITSWITMHVSCYCTVVALLCKFQLCRKMPACVMWFVIQLHFVEYI